MKPSRKTRTGVSDIIHNPVYTGIGPFPRIIEDELWIRSMARSVEANGAEKAFLRMAEAVERSFGIPAMKGLRTPKSLARLGTQVRREGAEQFFSKLLQNLRKNLAPLA